MFSHTKLSASATTSNLNETLLLTQSCLLSVSLRSVLSSRSWRLRCSLSGQPRERGGRRERERWWRTRRRLQVRNITPLHRCASSMKFYNSSDSQHLLYHLHTSAVMFAGVIRCPGSFYYQTPSLKPRIQHWWSSALCSGNASPTAALLSWSTATWH